MNPLKRNDSLDALRGVAILLMVLSGSIAFDGILPAWMYHAQVPPPSHKFNPDIPGITWVDLVFPFFLFSMGVAIPLALRKWEAEPNATQKVWWVAIRRYLLLIWFAIFIFHMRAWVIAENPGNMEHWLSILAFILLFFQLYQPNKEKQKIPFSVLRILSYAISAILLYALPFHNGQGFLKEKSDIIILVLANMAFFGTLIWWHTRNAFWLRIGILPVIMAIFLGGKITGSINETILNWSPIPWVYKCYYLKYLFIIIPGTFVGEWILKYDNESLPKKSLHLSSGLFLLAILFNVCLLFSRQIWLNLGITVGIIVANHFILRQFKDTLIYRFFLLGSYLLLLGLFFEAYEGGIKKDSSTYSYYFVTTGLACFLLAVFYSWQKTKIGVRINGYLASNGQNPMVAYVAGSLLLTPLLKLTGLQTGLDVLNANAWTGFLKGIIFTGIVSLLTYYFTKQKWFWKT